MVDIQGKNFRVHSEVGEVKVDANTHHIHFTLEQKELILTFDIPIVKDSLSLIGKIRLSDVPEESMVIASPFEKLDHFYDDQ